MLNDALADVLHNDRKLVAADVRVRVDKDRRVSAEKHELVKHLTNITTL